MEVKRELRSYRSTFPYSQGEEKPREEGKFSKGRQLGQRSEFCLLVPKGVWST